MTTHHVHARVGQTGVLLWLLAVGMACSTERGSAGTYGPGAAGDDGGGDGSANDDGNDGDDGGGDGDGTNEDGGGIKYDVEDGSGGPGDQQEGCGKVDFLFVVDPSNSMRDDRENLINNFPAFIDGIQSTLAEVDDYHVGVIKTRGYEGNISQPGCDQDGALVVEMPEYHYAHEDDYPARACGPYAEGHNYMTMADDLATTFSCAADMRADWWGNLELPMQSLLRAADGSLADPGECNEGYLRADSLLVVVIITDEPDGPGDPEPFDDLYCGPGNSNDVTPEECYSPGTPADWFDELVAARGGMEKNIVVLSLVAGQTVSCVGWWPPEDASHDNIIEFTEMFTHGIVAGICEPDYGPHFQEAISVIDVACDEYLPPEG